MTRFATRLAIAAIMAPLVFGGQARADANQWALTGVTIGPATVTGVFFTDVYNYVNAFDITETGASNVEYNSALPGAGVSFTSLTALTVFDGLGDTLSFTFAAPGLDGSTNIEAIVASSETYVGVDGPITITGESGAAEIPEPATIAVFGAGLLGLVARRRRVG